MMYTYHISFIARNKLGQSGPGSATIQRDAPIKTSKDVDNVAKFIKKKQKYRAVTIMTWQELEG